MKIRQSIKGKYRPKNPVKYVGKVNGIIYRSMLERRVMVYLDKSPKITEWSSEEIFVPYKDPDDGRNRNYYPDFTVRTTTGRTIMIEVKPYWQRSWKINKAKWKSATEYCESRDIEFKVLTEREIYGKQKKTIS